MSLRPIHARRVRRLINGLLLHPRPHPAILPDHRDCTPFVMEGAPDVSLADTPAPREEPTPLHELITPTPASATPLPAKVATTPALAPPPAAMGQQTPNRVLSAQTTVTPQSSTSSPPEPADLQTMPTPTTPKREHAPAQRAGQFFASIAWQGHRQTQGQPEPVGRTQDRAAAAPSQPHQPRVERASVFFALVPWNGEVATEPGPSTQTFAGFYFKNVPWTGAAV